MIYLSHADHTPVTEAQRALRSAVNAMWEQLGAQVAQRLDAELLAALRDFLGGDFDLQSLRGRLHAVTWQGRNFTDYSCDGVAILREWRGTPSIVDGMGRKLMRIEQRFERLHQDPKVC